MNKLKLPLWSDIVYLLLTIVAPMVFIVIEAMKVPSTNAIDNTKKLKYNSICYD